MTEEKIFLVNLIKHLIKNPKTDYDLGWNDCLAQIEELENSLSKEEIGYILSRFEDIKDLTLNEKELLKKLKEMT